MRKLLHLSFLLLLLLSAASASMAADFKLPRPGRAFQFPADHGAHPDYKTEWWYYVGRLKAAGGESYGYQLTFFRVALRQPDPEARSAWRLNTVYFAHLALSDPGRGVFSFREKTGRGALGLSGAEPGRLQVWIDSWQAEQVGDEMHLKAQAEGLGLDLTLKPAKPPVLHGEGGFSRKAERFESASYYYSLPRLATSGRLKVGGRSLEVTGLSWMDHEFFTSTLAPAQVGWDWFALQLDDGSDLMLYLLRHRDGSIDPASSGTLVDPRGGALHLKLEDFKVKATGAWKSPHSQVRYPAVWEIVVPRWGYRLTLTPTMADQELRTGAPAAVTYWEGEVEVRGEKRGQPVKGQGYVELTGYAGAMGGRF